MSKVSFGIDVTDQDIRMVSLVHRGESYSLQDCQLVPRSDSEAVKKLLQTVQARKNRVRFSIRDPSTKVKTVTIPKVPKNELDGVVSWAFKEAAKVPLEPYVIRYVPLGSGDEEKNPYLVFGLERKHVQERVIELKKLGVREPEQVEPHILALSNCIAFNYPELEQVVKGFVWVDLSEAMCGVIGAEGLLYQRTFSGVRPASSGSDSGVMLSKVGIEVQYSCENFAEQLPKHHVERIFLSGDLSDTQGLSQSVEEATGAHVELIDPFRKIEISTELKQQMPGDLKLFTVAFGLAL